MTRATESIDAERTSVHEAMQEISGAGDVFERFGLDTCCGGELPLATAAEHHDVELSRLLQALDEAAGAPEQTDQSDRSDRSDPARDGPAA